MDPFRYKISRFLKLVLFNVFINWTMQNTKERISSMSAMLIQTFRDVADSRRVPACQL